ncbi:hypothetical protein I4F81_009485 [Pyropia yezoensis]|uniref:Uncharacterized protein n=1 Tax=Pyropia yezoensis TaxID=2788 RepID=A0ACC3CB08_PYRYE|nr:hypothetical protein I4F81_009485 [Neopyropia yezoensis]
MANSPQGVATVTAATVHDRFTAVRQGRSTSPPVASGSRAGTRSSASRSASRPSARRAAASSDAPRVPPTSSVVKAGTSAVMAGGSGPSRRDRRSPGTAARPQVGVSAPLVPGAVVVPTRAMAKRPRLTALPPTPSALLPQSALAARLAVLTPAQLTDTLLRMASSVPGGEERLMKELPPPDMDATAASLTALNDDIVAHLPRRGGAPLFNEAAYRAVSTRAATRIVEEGGPDPMDCVELWMDLSDEYGEECPEVVDILESAIARRTGVAR